MSVFYILNKCTIFSPLEHKLISLTHNGHEHILNIPASRCLELLIEREYQLVPQQDFYKYVWGKEGNNVSVYALYQNIALLRKGLRDIDIELDNAIITVPKKGFQLSKTLSIIRTDEVIETKTKETLLPVPDVSPSVIEEVQDSNQDSNQDVDVNRAQKIPPARSLKRNLYYLLPLILVLAIAAAIVHKITIFSKDNFFSNYHPIESPKNCHFFINNKEFDNNIKDMLWISHGVDCIHQPYVYITRSEFSDFSSVLMCEKKFSSHTDPACDTYVQLSVQKK